jgi:hypothetical protein
MRKSLFFHEVAYAPFLLISSLQAPMWLLIGC